ncbi:serine/threonine protein kinase [Fusarium proliferatum]|nr:serine/threonine protein kinase [Fusarium proliferatum]
MSTSSSSLPFTIAEDDTAQPENPVGACNSMSRLENSPIKSSPPNDLSGLVSRLNELKLDPSSSISRSRVVAVANEDGGVIVKGDGKPVDFPSGGLSIEQSPDKPYFTIGSDNITISGYYSPDADDIIIHRRETNEVKLASYSTVTNEMTPLRSVKAPFPLNTGLWQISESGRMQIYLYIFPKPYIFHISSRPSKRPHFESVETAPHPRKKVHLDQPRQKKPVMKMQNYTKGTEKTDVRAETSNLELLRLSRSVTAFRIDTISISQPGRRQKTRNCFKLGAPELAFSQPSTTCVFTGQHAQHGLVSFKTVAYPTRGLVQHAQRWCREVSAARKINHRFLTTVLSADARLLSLCLDGQPILLCQRDDQSYFTGSNHEAEDTAGLEISDEEMKWYAAPEHVFTKPATPLARRIPPDVSREEGKKDVFSLAVILAYDTMAEEHRAY